jgi:hypothetical protein
MKRSRQCGLNKFTKLLLCDYCQESYMTEVEQPFGNNFCTYECCMLYGAKIQIINEHIKTVFARTYEEKPKSTYITHQDKYDLLTRAFNNMKKIQENNRNNKQKDI